MCRQTLRLLTLLLSSIPFASSPDAPAAETASAGATGDAVRGWEVFARKQCIVCHSVWDLGGKSGPDLGRIAPGRLTHAELGGVLWNHVPRVASHARRIRAEFPTLSATEARDLFAFLDFVRHLEGPGDPAKGRRALREKGCAHCHPTVVGSPPDRPGLDLRRWGLYANPILWAQKMWEHAPRMEKAMKEAGITWPRLDDSDLVDLIAYVRTLGRTESHVYLKPGSPRAGEQVFNEKKCRSCHHQGGSGDDFSAAELPRSLSALAIRMWNHSPQMSRRMQAAGGERARIAPQEMADLIAYLLSLPESSRAGDPDRGRRVFTDHRCDQCHREATREGESVPSLVSLATAATGPALARALWNHGAATLDLLSESGHTWPVFERGETGDLIAYLKSFGTPAGGTSIAAGGTVAPPSPATSVPSSPRATAADRVVSPIQVASLPAGPPIQEGASCVSRDCHARVVADRVVHAPVAQGECSACHRVVSAATHEIALKSESSDLCYDCHDRPPRFEHGKEPVAVSVCTACHAPHSSENAFGPGFTGSEMCYTELIGMTSALSTLAGAGGSATTAASLSPQRVAAPEPTAGALPPGVVPAASVANPLTGVGGTAATGTGNISSLPRSAAPLVTTVTGCTSGNCHVAIMSSPVLHPPAAQQQCEACHRVSDEKEHRFELTAKEPELCYQCHEENKGSAAFVHGPVGLGLCTPCHNPHGSEHRLMLPATGSDLCFMCHSELADHVAAARVPHKPLTESERPCLTCHDAHQSEHKFHLRDEVPNLCYGCHETTRAAIDQVAVEHAPVTTGNRCANCHDPHGGNVEKLLVDNEMDLCLGCHDKPLDTPSGPIADMKSRIENNPERHGPLREGSCTVCHLPHGSENFRILRNTFPKEFYRPFSIKEYALCFECHQESIVLDERTTTLTSFRNGSKNLHYVHVNQKKGRTCRACHEIHAGTKPKRMKDFVPFGDWKYPVNFEQTAEGGRCSPGCHLPRAYSRVREIIQK